MREKKPKPLHQRLHALLEQKWRHKDITQESLAEAMGMAQETVGAYLRGVKAGPLDLDEAVAALEHIGSSLPDFLARIPPRDLTTTERVARALQARPVLVEFVEDLIAVPRTRLPAVLDLVRAGVFAATGQRAAGNGAIHHASRPATRSRAGRGRRREVPTK